MHIFFTERFKALLVSSSADDETSNVLKRSVKNMFAHVLALCFILRLSLLEFYFIVTKAVIRVFKNSF